MDILFRLLRRLVFLLILSVHAVGNAQTVATNPTVPVASNTAVSPDTSGANQPANWTDIRSENWDAFFAIASIAIGSSGIVIAVMIFLRQRRDSKLLEKRIFGTLPDIKSVNERIIELLELAENTPDSSVSLMVYWAWFGADLSYPHVKLPDINGDTSKVCQLLHARFSKNLKTHLVMFKANERLKQFVDAVFKYRAHQINQPPDFQDSDVTDLLKRYETHTSILSQHEGQRRADAHNQTQLKRFDEIPNLLFAVRSGRIEAGIIYLGETPTLLHFADTGGFYTEDPVMVKILEKQISEYER